MKKPVIPQASRAREDEQGEPKVRLVTSLLGRRAFLLTAASLTATVLASAVHAATGAPARKTRIGVIGSGRIGGTVGGLW